MQTDPCMAEIFPLLDLTCLNQESRADDVTQLCEKAAFGPSQAAAVCVRPEWVSHARHLLKDTPVKIATVANFPEGKLPTETVQTNISESIHNGAVEIDVVFPRHLFFAGNKKAVRNFLSACRAACASSTLKVILESGAFTDRKSLADACLLACECGADFLKTSTGKYTVGATPSAAAILLRVISQSFPDRGIKISGGIRTMVDALRYISQACEIMGRGWITPAHFRIGASHLAPSPSR